MPMRSPAFGRVQMVLGLALLGLLYGCSGITVNREAPLIERLEQVPVAQHSGLQYPGHDPTYKAGQRIEVDGCCILGELRMTISWKSFNIYDDRLYVSGYVHEANTENRLSETHVIAGRITKKVDDARHRARVVAVALTDESGYFEMTIPRERKLRLYAAMVSMATAEYDISTLLR